MEDRAMTMFRGNGASCPARRAWRARGFTLIEIMIAIVVVGILTAIALPQYNEFVMRSRIVDGTSAMNDFRTRMEQFFQDNRTYTSGGAACGVTAPPAPPAPGHDPNAAFDLTCGGADATGYALSATGRSSKGMGAFTYTLTIAGGVLTKATTTVPAGWTAAANCWVTRKNGECS